MNETSRDVAARVIKAAMAFAEAGHSVLSAEQIPSKIIHEIYDAVRAFNAVFQLGASAEITPDDFSGQVMLVSHTDEKIRIDFGKELRWFSMSKDQAIQFGLLIFQHCGVPVEVNLAPAPEAQRGEPV